jgi:hypothetical protein
MNVNVVESYHWQKVIAQVEKKSTEKFSKPKSGNGQLSGSLRVKIKQVVDETMTVILNEESLKQQKIIGNSHSSPKMAEKWVKSLRQKIEASFETATKQTIKQTAKKQGVALTNLHQVTKTPLFSKILEKKINEDFSKKQAKQTFDTLTAVKDPVYLQLKKKYHELEESFKKVKEAYIKLNELKSNPVNNKKDKIELESLEKEVHTFVSENQRFIQDFEKNTSSLIQQALLKAEPQLAKNKTKFSQFAQECKESLFIEREKGLLQLADKIIKGSQNFKLLESQHKLDKAATAWKEFEKDIVSFIGSKDSPNAKLFNKNQGYFRQLINQITDEWKIDYNK